MVACSRCVVSERVREVCCLVFEKSAACLLCLLCCGTFGVLIYSSVEFAEGNNRAARYVKSACKVTGSAVEVQTLYSSRALRVTTWPTWNVSLHPGAYARLYAEGHATTADGQASGTSTSAGVDVDHLPHPFNAVVLGGRTKTWADANRTLALHPVGSIGPCSFDPTHITIAMQVSGEERREGVFDHNDHHISSFVVTGGL